MIKPKFYPPMYFSGLLGWYLVSYMTRQTCSLTHWPIFLKKTRAINYRYNNLTKYTERIKMQHLFKRISIHLTSIHIYIYIDKKKCFLLFCSVITPFWNIFGLYHYLGFMFRVFVFLVSSYRPFTAYCWIRW